MRRKKHIGKNSIYIFFVVYKLHRLCWNPSPWRSVSEKSFSIFIHLNCSTRNFFYINFGKFKICVVASFSSATAASCVFNLQHIFSVSSSIRIKPAMVEFSPSFILLMILLSSICWCSDIRNITSGTGTRDITVASTKKTTHLIVYVINHNLLSSFAFFNFMPIEIMCNIIFK